MTLYMIELQGWAFIRLWKRSGTEGTWMPIYVNMKGVECSLEHTKCKLLMDTWGLNPEFCLRSTRTTLSWIFLDMNILWIIIDIVICCVYIWWYTLILFWLRQLLIYEYSDMCHCMSDWWYVMLSVIWFSCWVSIHNCFDVQVRAKVKLTSHE